MKFCYRTSAALTTATLFPKLLGQCFHLIDALGDAEFLLQGGSVSPMLLFYWKPPAGSAKAYLMLVKEGKITISCCMGPRFGQPKLCSCAVLWGIGRGRGWERSQSMPTMNMDGHPSIYFKHITSLSEREKRKKKERKEKTYKIRFVSLI